MRVFKNYFKIVKGHKFANEDLEKEIDVGIKNEKNLGNEDKSLFYFNFINYLILAQVLLIVSTIVSVYKKKTIAMRNAASPMSKYKQNLEIGRAHV